MDYYTEFKTLDNQTLQLKVITDNITETDIITFTSKLSLIKYIDRLRKNLSKQIDKETGEIIQTQTKIPLCIIDTIRNITTRFNLTEQSQKVTQELSNQLKRSDRLRFIPKTMVSVSKTDKTIKSEKLQKIMNYFVKGQITESKLIQELEDLQ